MKKCTDCGKTTGGKSRCEHCHQKHKERLLKRKTQGICLGCGNLVIAGHNYCANCLEKMRQRRAVIVQRMNTEGICQACGSKPVHIKQDGKQARFCEACLTKRRAKDSERWQKGCCVNCGEPAYIKPDGKLARRCEKHYRHYQELCRRQYYERKAAGLCTKCGQPAAHDGERLLSMCGECLNKQADRRYRRKKGL